jgi:hypothetical protein
MRPIRKLDWLLAGTLLATFAQAAPARAAEPSPPQIIQKLKASDFPSANTVYVVDDQTVTFQDDGSFDYTFHTIQLVLTKEGIAHAATLSLDYAKDAEKIDLVSARVLKAGGQVVDVGAQNVKDTEQAGEANIYDPNGRSLRLSVDGLAVGDAVDVTYKLKRATPTRPGYFADTFYFQGTVPILSATYTVDGPASKPLATSITHGERAGQIVATKTASGDRVRYQWKAKKTPQIIYEASMNYSNEVASLVVSTDPSWESFSRWWSSVTEPQLEVTPELKQKADELVRKATNDTEKIQALFEFVSADVRYRGLGVGPRTGYTPRKAQETYASRWGVCRDVAILLTALLRAEGFDAYPVLTNMGDPVLPKIAYDGFNHAIVALRGPSGWTFLDPTVKNTKDWLPIFEREQSVLVCTPHGEPLATTAALPVGSNLGRAEAKTTVGADGSMHSLVKVTTSGYFDYVLRSYAAMLSKKQLHDALEGMVHSGLPAAKVTSIDVVTPDAGGSTLSIELDLPAALVATGDYRLLRTVVTSGALGLVEYYLPSLLGGAPARKYTLDAQIPFQFDQVETITLPGDTRVAALPNPAQSVNQVSSLSATCSVVDAHTLECKRSFQMKTRYIDPRQYLELRGVMAQLAQIARQPVILGAAGGK